MKQLNIVLEDSEHRRLLSKKKLLSRKKKRNVNWHDFIMTLAE